MGSDRYRARLKAFEEASVRRVESAPMKSDRDNSHRTFDTFPSLQRNDHRYTKLTFPSRTHLPVGSTRGTITP